MATVKRITMAKLNYLQATNVQPEKMKTSEGIGVRSGRRLITLVDSGGKKTAAGKWWEKKSGEALPEGGFMQQKAMREGNTETIRLRDGRKGITRRWDPGSGEYKFTALGKKYYSTLRRNYVVDVPIVVNGKRQNGSTYQIRSHVKMEKLGLRPVEVPLSMTLEERRNFIKDSIKKQMERTTDAIYRISDEEWFYDDDGSWAINE